MTDIHLLHIKMPADLLAKIDRWRSLTRPILSRPAAIREMCAIQCKADVKFLEGVVHDHSQP